MILLTVLLTSRAPSGPSHRRFGWGCPGDIRARHAAAQGSRKPASRELCASERDRATRYGAVDSGQACWLDSVLMRLLPVGAVQEYQDGYHLDKHLKGAEFLTSRDNTIDDVWQSIINICTHLELLTTFSFRKQEANTADRKLGSVQRKFDEVSAMKTLRIATWITSLMCQPPLQVVLDVIVASAKRDSDREARTENSRIKPLAPMLQPKFPLHTKSRGSHPEYSKPRAPVADEQVRWDFAWKEYKPEEFTHRDVEAQPPWADPPDPADEDYRKQLLGRITTAICNPEAPGVEKKPVTLKDAQQRFNKDGTRNEYVVEFEQNGRPRNPHGRTGLRAYSHSQAHQILMC